MFSLDKRWKLVIEVNEIPTSDLGDKAAGFVRSVTRQFQERGDLSQRQWLALERIAQFYRPEHDFDPTILASDCDE